MRYVLSTTDSLAGPQLVQLPSPSRVSQADLHALGFIVKPQLPSVQRRPDGPPPSTAQALSKGVAPNTLPQKAPSCVRNCLRSTSEEVSAAKRPRSEMRTVLPSALVRAARQAETAFCPVVLSAPVFHSGASPSAPAKETA